MLFNIFLVLQIISVTATGVVLWQIWRRFRAIPEDTVIGEERAAELCRWLSVLSVCVGATAVLCILRTMLDFIGKL